MLLFLAGAVALALFANGPQPAARAAVHDHRGLHAKKKCRSRHHRSKRKCRAKKHAVIAPAPGPIDITPPGPPVLTATDPVSPASGTNPRIQGTAEPGSTVRIYTNQDCTQLNAVGTAEELATSRIAAHVPANSTTEFHANATDAAGRVSPCSSRLTYIEAPVQMDAIPALFPAFDPNVSDYVTRCDGTNPVSMSVDAPHNSRVSVDGSPGSDGSYSVPVALQAGQEFTFAVTAASYSKTFYVRCAPSDFPAWTFDRLEQPAHQFYAFTPTTSSHYAVLFDDNGVPVWWFQPTGAAPFDMKALSDGSIAWARNDGTGYEIRSLDGSLVRLASIVGSSTDIHDMQELGNGDLLLLSYRRRSGADLTHCGGSNNATVTDGVVQEIDQSGNLVHEWSSADFVAPDETPARWCQTVLSSGGDIVHINSVEPDGNALIISFRHLDAVYKIDRATGDVIWKLGGTPTPESLTVLNDPFGAYPLGGQHDARVLPDGTITIHDNDTGLTDQPLRAVRYALDEDARTATLIESVTDPENTSSGCCGSARRSTTGAWTMSWGARPFVTEFDAAGNRTFRLTMPLGTFSYRAFPVADGLITASALRAGMDAQFPRP